MVRKYVAAFYTIICCFFCLSNSAYRPPRSIRRSTSNRIRPLYTSLLPRNTTCLDPFSPRNCSEKAYGYRPEHNPTNTYIIAAIFPNGSNEMFFDLSYVKCLLEAGVDKINHELEAEWTEMMLIQQAEDFKHGGYGQNYGNERVKFKLDFINTEGVTTCKDMENKVAYLASQWVKRLNTKNAVAWIGPGCSAGAQQLGHLIREWNVAWLDGAAVSTKLDNKEIYPTLIRTGWTMWRMAEFVEKIFIRYKWRNFALIYDDEDPIWTVFGQGIADYFKTLKRPAEGYPNTTEPAYNFIQYLFQKGDRNDIASVSEIFYAAFDAIKRQTRVVLFMGGGWLAKNFLLVADDLGYVTDEWTYIIPDVFDFDPVTTRGPNRSVSFDTWQDVIPRHRSELQEADKRTLLLSFREFVPLLDLETAMTDVKCPHQTLAACAVKLQEGSQNSHKPLGWSALNYYAALRMFGEVFRDAIVNGTPEITGTILAERMQNRSFFIDDLGISVKTDEYGDVRGDYLLKLYDGSSRKFVVAYRYNADDTDLTQEQQFTWHPALNKPACGYLDEDCLDAGIIAVIVLLSCMFVGTVVWLICYQRKSTRRLKDSIRTYEKWWEISWNDIHLQGPTQATIPRQLKRCRVTGIMTSGNSTPPLPKSKISFLKTVQHGTLHGSPVCVRFIQKEVCAMHLQKALKNIRDLNHENLVRVIGICIEPSHQAIVTEYCSRGELPDLLLNQTIKLEWAFRFSLIADLLEATMFLHKSSYEYHGMLTSWRCMIDSRFCLKIRDYSLKQLREEEINPSRLLWTAPEILRRGYDNLVDFKSFRAADIYSVGITLKEIGTRTRPYAMHGVSYEEEPTCAEVIKRVTNFSLVPYRPQVFELQDCAGGLRKLIENCWTEEPSHRPTIDQLVDQFKTLRRHSKGNMFDDLMMRLERYANELEHLVEERTKQYVKQQQRTQDLLHELLPRSVAMQLIHDGKVPPEAYECVTVYFSDIVSFTDLSAESSPLEIVELLNELFSMFDKIIDAYDAYKVETVGDAYMVVSGLPHRNGVQHATEIARLAIQVRDETSSFRIPHRRTESIQLRIGLHSGPCMAGVVGSRMPRYCLFGDTVNTASRMESTGQAGRIQMSASTAQYLIRSNANNVTEFQVECRGNISVKGKGQMETYWLNGCTVLDGSCRSSSTA